MTSIKRMQKIRRILSKAIYNKPYAKLTDLQSKYIAKKVKNVIRREK